MRILICWSFFSYLLLCFGCATAQNDQKIKKREKYNYLIYVPNGYTTQKTAYPLVIYLHGGSQRGQDLAKLKVYGLPHQVDKGRNFSFIIASPQCPDGKFWSTDNWLEPLLDELKKTYRIDSKRIYLTGISMGGYGTWQTAVAYPTVFAALMPLCGGCDDSTQICRIKNVPVWTFHGTADDQVSIDETERLVRRLDQCEGKVKFTRLPNEGHSIQHLYDDQTLYDWLLKQHK